MDTRLESLDPIFLPKAERLLARFVEAGILVKIINTRRTPEEQLEAIASGHSWVSHSKHMDGLAIDVCPYSQFTLHGSNKLDWDANDPVWMQMGLLGESLNLRWGGRWIQRDLGHFEYV